MENGCSCVLVSAVIALVLSGLLSPGATSDEVVEGSGEVDHDGAQGMGAGDGGPLGEDGGTGGGEGGVAEPGGAGGGGVGVGGGSVRDVVDEFLSIVEQYEKNKENCTPGTTFNLGKGVVAQYGLRRFQQQAMVAVNRANFLTRVWKGMDKGLLDSEYFFYTAVRSMVEGDPGLFAAGNCYDQLEYKDYTLFCPFAYRLPNDSSEIMVKDLSVEYMYLDKESEFFYAPRQKAESKLEKRYTESHGEYHIKHSLLCCPI